MNDPHESPTSRGVETPERPQFPARTTSLENEIAALKEANAHLRQRLHETELRAEMRVRASGILAIPSQHE